MKTKNHETMIENFLNNEIDMRRVRESLSFEVANLGLDSEDEDRLNELLDNVQITYRFKQPQAVKSCIACWTDNAKERTHCKHCGEVLIESFASDAEFLEEIDELVDEYAGEPEQSRYLKLQVHAHDLYKRAGG